MLDRLNVRYSSRVTNGGWSGAKYLRAEQVPIGLRYERHRICDYVATSMHCTPWSREHPVAFPPVFHGHEVKVSRSDWLAELRDPSKAATFQAHMHYWWLVAAARDIVRDDLPEGWGLLIPHGPRTLRVVVPAALNPDPEPMSHSLQGALLRAVATTEARLAQVDLAARRDVS
ncbi:hypothetical protein F9L07_03635 [Pimelobacter simplex]|uniref:Uncharacterized protein n=1 Tax=Nocardioides simplex TaxID=2045 RepID=A0A7J5DYG3_NOCSI|nr:hypothetical protein [Pimelobacter simplex]KAB2811035.1 hypothetical protein F9L07_03635 [Pimelobacter simplex]